MIGVVDAATTIGTNIFTGGTLSVGSSTPSTDTLFSVGTSSPILFVSTSTGYMGIGNNTPRAPMDFYKLREGIIFTGGLVEMDGLEDFTAGAHGSCSAGTCGLTGGDSGGPLMRSEADRAQLPVGAVYTVDIGISRQIRAITWGTYWRSSIDSQFSAYTIDYSDDASTWTNMVTVTNNTKAVVLHYFDPEISARYIRITNTGSHQVFMSNLQILGYTLQNQRSNQPWGTVLSNWGSGGFNDGNVVLREVGNVGLGTSTMPYKLTVDNSGWNSFSSANTLASFQNSYGIATSTIARIFFSANRGSGGGTMTDIAGVGGMITDVSPNAYKGALTFYTANNSTPTEVARFDENGNFGIGTTTPITQLQVTTSASNATSTLTVGKTGQNKGSCLELFDSTGTVKYVSIIGGSLVVSATSCK